MKRHPCYNRRTYDETVEVQDGWTIDGQRKMKTVPFRMSHLCNYDNKLTDAGCQGCKWQTINDELSI
jgi:hypothetical protein